jgi:hypothetical protein
MLITVNEKQKGKYLDTVSVSKTLLFDVMKTSGLTRAVRYLKLIIS